MNKKTTTALDEYINKVYAITLLAATGACQCAGIVYTVEKLLGLVPMVNMIALLIFDLTCLIYLSIAIVLSLLVLAHYFWIINWLQLQRLKFLYLL